MKKPDKVVQRVHSFLLCVSLTIFSLCANAFAAEKEPDPMEWDREYTHFYDQIAQHDLSGVFVYRAEEEHPFDDDFLGFIGDDLQRFYIHFTSVTRSSENPNEYQVKGKTRVKKNVCTFQGTITAKRAGLLVKDESEEQDFPGIKEGFVLADVELFEEKSQSGSGIIRGTLVSDFYIDENGKLVYNDLMVIADGFSNNQFWGSWTSYRTGAKKICNFGLWRIPRTGLPDGVWLDQGAGHFMPDEKYYDKGWQTYVDHIRYSYDENPSAHQEEAREWWK